MRVLKIGKPTHYRPNNKNESACGVVSPEYAAYDLILRDVRLYEGYNDDD